MSDTGPRGSSLVQEFFFSLDVGDLLVKVIVLLFRMMLLVFLTQGTKDMIYNIHSYALYDQYVDKCVVLEKQCFSEGRPKIVRQTACLMAVLSQEHTNAKCWDS